MKHGNVIKNWIERNFKEAPLRKPLAKFLVAFTSALVNARSFIPAHLGRWMGSGLARSGIQRVGRFYSNESLDVSTLDEHFKTSFIAQVSGSGELWLQWDWTTIREKFQLLCLAWIEKDGKRSIPAHFCGYDHADGTEITAHDGWELHALKWLASCGKIAQRITLLMDRGFDSVKNLRRLQARGFHYIARMAQCEMIRLPGQDHFIEARNSMLKRGQRIDFGWITYTQAHLFRVRMVGIWDPRQEEPWFLLTDRDDLTVDHLGERYSRRMAIEELFKSMKNETLGFLLKSILIQKIDRWRRILWFVTVAFQFLAFLGTRLREIPRIEQRYSPSSRVPKRQEWIFSIYRLAYHVLHDRLIILEWMGECLGIRFPGAPLLALEK